MSDPVLVVTGAAGALGRVLVAEARAAGWRVAALDHGRCESDGADMVVNGVDLIDAEAAQAAVDQVAAQLGRVDALANVAGGFVWQTVEDGDPAAWARHHALNVTTVLNATRAALPALKAAPDGRIVNVGSAAAIKPGAGMGAYGAAKLGVHALTQSLAEELKATSVTVNAVLPSIIDTPQNRKDMPDADPAAWVEPKDLAAVILFLASPASRAMTGALVPVTGRV